MRQVRQQQIRPAGFKIRRRRDARSHRNCPDAVFTRGNHVLGGVADQRNPANWPLVLRLFDRQPREAAARGRHFAERPEAKVMLQARAFQLAPTDAGQIAGYQRQRGSPPAQMIEQVHHARTLLIPQIRHAVLIDILRRLNDRRHQRADSRIIKPTSAHHERENVRIEHSMHRDAIGRGFKTGDLPNGINQRLTMMRSGAAHQRSVDVEKN